MGRPAPLTRRWILVVKPPLERPKPCLGVPLLRPLPDDGREPRYCRSSGGRLEPARFRSGPPVSLPTARLASSAGTGGRLTTTCRTLRAGHAMANRSVRPRKSRPEQADGSKDALAKRDSDDLNRKSLSEHGGYGTVSTQNPSSKHHYIPAFYLRRWEDPSDGKLTRFKMVNTS